MRVLGRTATPSRPAQDQSQSRTTDLAVLGAVGIGLRGVRPRELALLADRLAEGRRRPHRRCGRRFSHPSPVPPSPGGGALRPDLLQVEPEVLARGDAVGGERLRHGRAEADGGRRGRAVLERVGPPDERHLHRETNLNTEPHNPQTEPTTARTRRRPHLHLEPVLVDRRDRHVPQDAVGREQLERLLEGGVVVGEALGVRPGAVRAGVVRHPRVVDPAHPVQARPGRPGTSRVETRIPAPRGARRRLRERRRRETVFFEVTTPAVAAAPQRGPEAGGRARPERGEGGRGVSRLV